MSEPKITLMLTKAGYPSLQDFAVIRATNTVEYLPGDGLSKKLVKQLIANGVTINIVPRK